MSEDVVRKCDTRVVKEKEGRGGERAVKIVIGTHIM